jgi:DNA (cytosine-5)-methyltransferase 1
VNRPLACDLFCGAGGVSVGLERAGFDVVGVDIRPQPRYRGGHFVRADALEFPLDIFDFVWASPPCQAYTVSRTRARVRKAHPDLVGSVRARLEAWGGIWTIENVPGAPLRHGVVLCGATFGLGATDEHGIFRALRRHRLFESSFAMLSPPCHCVGGEKIGVYGNGGGRADRKEPDRRGYKGNAAEARQALGIDWMTLVELSQAIPPAYSEWIGERVLAEIRQRRAA